MDWLKEIDFSDMCSPPIQHKVNLNVYNVSILKRYISKSYIENIENVNIAEDVISDNTDKWQTLDNFEGYVSASLCFLYLIEDVLKEIAQGETPEDVDDYSTSLAFIRLMGNYNKTQKVNAFDDAVTTDFDGDSVFDEHWDDIDIMTLPQKIQGKLLDFCPPRQFRLFYAVWNRFCILFLGNILNTDENECDLLYSVSKIKYIVLASLDNCLDMYLEKYHDETYVFWNSMVKLFITCEFKLDGYENVVVEMDSLFKNNKLSWQEHVKKEISYTEDDATNINNVLNYVKDDRIGLQIATNLLFAEQNNA